MSPLNLLGLFRTQNEFFYNYATRNELHGKPTFWKHKILSIRYHHACYTCRYNILVANPECALGYSNFELLKENWYDSYSFGLEKKE
jgi:hypothetical protein